jgi:hypothetical protein
VFLENLGVGWNDNIKTHLKEIGWQEVDGINLAEDRKKHRVGNAVINLRAP